MEIKPLFDRIIVRRTDSEEVTEGGIFLPSAAQDKRQEGEVIAVGLGKEQADGSILPLQLKGGEQIIFGKYSGNEVALDGETYLVMREDEVLAVVTT